MNEVIAILQNLIQQAAEIADQLTPEEMQMVMQVFAEAIRVIQESQSQEAPIEGAQSPLEPSMASSNIHSFGYDDKTGELRVKFNGKDQRDAGSVYSFTGIPSVIFDLFRKGAVPARTTGSNRWGKWWRGKVPSAGASFYSLIRTQGYPYKKVA